MDFVKIAFTILILVLTSNGSDLYPNYNVSIDPRKVQEWSDDRALAYVETVRLFDYDHHIFQYRRYPCQYFYTDEIQLYNSNTTVRECLYNATTGEYEYGFQLHFDSRHVEPFILRNIAIKCNYVNCSLSLLNLTYVYIGWNLRGKELNPDCSFDINQAYNIFRAPYTVSEWISLRCKTSAACSNAESTIEQSLPAYVQLIYGSSYELEAPYCSLEQSLSHVIETNFAKTNRLMEQLVELMQRRLGSKDDRDQNRLKEYAENLVTTTTTENLETTTTTTENLETTTTTTENLETTTTTENLETTTTTEIPIIDDLLHGIQENLEAN